MAVSWMRDACVGLDGGEQGGVVHHDLEGVDVIVLVDGDDQTVCLPQSLRDTLFCRFRLMGEHLLAERIDRLVLELAPDLFPAQVFANPRARRVEAVPGRHGQDDGVAMDPGTVGGGRLVDEAFGRGTRPAGLRSGLRAENGVMEVAVVRDVARSFRQGVNPGAGRGRARGERFQLLDGADDLRFHQGGWHAVVTGIVVHLAQVGAIAQPPRPRQVGRY